MHTEELVQVVQPDEHIDVKLLVGSIKYPVLAVWQETTLFVT